MGWLSVALLAVPLLGALGLVVFPAALRPVLRVYGLVGSGVTLALAVLMLVAF
ncbi:MAG: NADH-quinone oxidoreductase subunit M, partial [Nonomuraea sp.]|nr:NADH-quinone oxidoreductase subunit M [Nonomuraea sp.]